MSGAGTLTPESPASVPPDSSRFYVAILADDPPFGIRAHTARLFSAILLAYGHLRYITAMSNTS
jgi:hypothetical protein